MQFDPNRLGYRAGSTPGQKPGILSKAVAFIATVAIASVALMFSVFLFAIALVVGLCIWAWLWWKMRGLRKQMQQQMHRAEPGMRQRQQRNGQGADILEGEVIREVDEARQSHRSE